MSGAPAPLDADAAPARPVRAFVALGSNVGDRAAHLEAARAAMAALAQTRVVARSGVHETEPVGPAGQGPYLNAVDELETALAPRALLEALLAIERTRGRDRSGVWRGPPRRGRAHRRPRPPGAASAHGGAGVRAAPAG
jgi:2-amino-4-hydroxy-6-hydroxymethyldihydropteridine diphosphokinase